MAALGGLGTIVSLISTVVPLLMGGNDDSPSYSMPEMPTPPDLESGKELQEQQDEEVRKATDEAQRREQLRAITGKNQSTAILSNVNTENETLLQDTSLFKN